MMMALLQAEVGKHSHDIGPLFGKVFGEDGGSVTPLMYFVMVGYECGYVRERQSRLLCSAL
jgi:hypothetical protein